jgi:hypothetical protein
MAKATNRRLLVHSLCLALAFLLLTAGAAMARPGGPSKRESAGRVSEFGGRVKVAHARALGAKCASRGAARTQITSLRRRCAPAAASRTPQPLYWGATIGPQITGSQAPWDMNAVSRFEEISHKPASIIQFFQPFAECAGSSCSFFSFPTTPLENIRQHGSIPVLSWSSQSIPSSLEEPDFQLSDVIEGRYDAYISDFASQAAAWGHPFFIRFNWEMNGNWFPWSEGVNGNGPGQYVAAWRHVHDLFVAAGASNVSWVWCPFVDPGSSLQGLASLYPGDAYVDWTGLDGYNWGTNPSSARGWKSFDQLFSRSYGEIAEGIAPSKPMMIGEVGSSEQGGSKAAWIQNALATVPAEYPKIRALLWFDKYDDGMDWPLETSTAASAAFAEGIQDPMYVGNSYAEVPGSPIQPPI